MRHGSIEYAFCEQRGEDYFFICNRCEIGNLIFVGYQHRSFEIFIVVGIFYGGDDSAWCNFDEFGSYSIVPVAVSSIEYASDGGIGLAFRRD